MSKGMEWEKFWYKDFMSDLKSCSAQTRGFWISFLSYLWERGGIGEFTGTIEDFCRITACGQLEVENSIRELSEKEVCSYQQGSNGNVTLINRRLKREEKERESIRLRVGQFRKKQQCNANVPKCNAVEDRRKKIEERKEIKASVNNQGENENDGSFKIKTQEALNKLLIKFPRFPHARLLGNAFSLKKHPQAIIDALNETREKSNGLDPAKYFEAILNRTSGNYYEQEHTKQAESYKLNPNQIGNILKAVNNNDK